MLVSFLISFKRHEVPCLQVFDISPRAAGLSILQKPDGQPRPSPLFFVVKLVNRICLDFREFIKSKFLSLPSKVTPWINLNTVYPGNFISNKRPPKCCTLKLEMIYFLVF